MPSGPHAMQPQIAPSAAKFDRTAYQREYMREYRKRQKDTNAKQV